MSSLKADSNKLEADFNELRERIRQRRETGSAGFEPVYYLVFSPQQIITVKQKTDTWRAWLSQDSWDVHTFSITEQVWAVLRDDPLWPLCIREDQLAPLNWQRTNQSLAEILNSEAGLRQRLEAGLLPLEGQKNALLLVTDLEALHPFLRIGAIESQLQGRFHVPTIFLYPGVRTGKTRLKFLGFYPEDGNYRSVHVGG